MVKRPQRSVVTGETDCKPPQLPANRRDIRESLRWRPRSAPPSVIAHPGASRAHPRAWRWPVYTDAVDRDRVTIRPGCEAPGQGGHPSRSSHEGLSTPHHRRLARSDGQRLYRPHRVLRSRLRVAPRSPGLHAARLTRPRPPPPIEAPSRSLQPRVRRRALPRAPAHERRIRARRRPRGRRWSRDRRSCYRRRACRAPW